MEHVGNAREQLPPFSEQDADEPVELDELDKISFSPPSAEANRLGEEAGVPRKDGAQSLEQFQKQRV